MPPHEFRQALRQIPVFAGVPDALTEQDLEALAHGDPMLLMRAWLLEALDAGETEPHVMSLSTVDAAGAPSSRVLLCKDIDDSRLYFATDSGSRKGRELAARSTVAAHFHWTTTARQVRVTGHAEALDRPASEQDFAERGRASQLAAAAFASGEYDNLEGVHAAIAALDRRYPDAVPCPASWTVYGITPSEVELWQGSRDRLHRRLLFQGAPGSWTATVLWH